MKNPKTSVVSPGKQQYHPATALKLEKTSLHDPSAGNFSYDYDDLGRLKKKTQKGSHTHLVSDYTYDPTHKMLTRLTVKDRGNSETLTYDYGYDDYQRPQTISESNAYAGFSQKLEYDKLGRLETETRVSSLKSGGSQTVNLSYGYAANGSRNKISKDGKALWTLQGQNARGQSSKMLLGNGITKNRHYDALGYLDKIDDGKALSVSYQYLKPKGVMTQRNRTSASLSRSRVTESFAHDKRNRLTSFTDGKKIFRQSYDDYGRIADNGRVGTYVYSESSRYVLDSVVLGGPGAHYYKRHPQQRVDYNMDRKAVKVTEEGEGTARFRYNHNLQRHHAFFESMEPVEVEENKNKKVVTPPPPPYKKRSFQKHYSTIFPAEITVWSVAEPVEATASIPSTSSGSSGVRFVDFVGGDAYTAPVAIINDQEHYLHRDHLGSILAISDANGTVIEERHFSPWGKVDWFRINGKEADFKDSILPRGFTGHEHFAGIALIHMNGRMYDPQLRRFLSPDNHIQDPYNTLSYDRFGYVWNNPLMAGDPSGELFWFAVAIGAFMGGVNAAMNGGNLGDILLGALIGGIAGGVGAGFANLAGGVGFFSNAALSVSGFGAGFTVGFAGGFVGGFVGATLTGLAAGRNIGEAIGGGIKAGLVGGTLAGLSAGIGAGVKARKAGGDFWSGKGANFEYWSAKFNEMGGQIQDGKESFLYEGIPAGHKPTDTGQIANTLSTNPANPNPNYGKYGWTRNGGDRAHFGVDYAGNVGDNVYAMYDGKVIRQWNSTSYGANAVRIQSTLNGRVYNIDYGHMSSHNVWVGQSVRGGETIGQMGRLGSAFSNKFTQHLWPTHVHVSVWRYVTEGNMRYRGFVQPWW